MLILTIVILLIATAVSYFYFSYNESGSATFDWLGETGVFPMAWIPYIIGFLLLFLLAAWILSLVLSVPRRLRRSGQMRSLSKSRNSLDQGLMAISAGEFEDGEASLTSYLEGTPADAVKYIAAAKSALVRGADGQAEQYLKKASDVSNSSGNAVRLTQAEMLMERGEFKDAETLLLNLHKSKPQNAHIMERLATALQNTGNSHKLSELTRLMRSKSNIPKEKILAFEQTAWTQIINSAEETELVNTFESLSKESRRDEHAIAAFAERLINVDDNERALNTLQHSISSNWSEKLVEVYGRVDAADSGKQLEQANNWLAKNPRSPALAMTIGRLSGKGQQWGKAKESLIKAAQMNLNPSVCTELGEVLSSMGDTKNAKDCFQSAAMLASGNSPVGALRDLENLPQLLSA